MTSTADYDYALLRDVVKESQVSKYRLKEWVRTKTPRSPVNEDGPEVENDPFEPEYITVRIKDLLAVQYHVNMPTVWYYVHCLRQFLMGDKNAEPERIRVKKWKDKWLVVNGTHRVEAYRYLKYKEIPAVWGFSGAW